MKDIDIPSIARDRADHPPAPTVEQVDGPDPGVGIVDCPHCGKEHVHGISEDPLTHRTAHCPDRDIPGRSRGYLLMRPIRGLLGLPVRWWERGASPFRPAGDGVGLLRIAEKMHEIRQRREQDGEADNG